MRHRVGEMQKNIVAKADKKPPDVDPAEGRDQVRDIDIALPEPARMDPNGMDFFPVFGFEDGADLRIADA